MANPINSAIVIFPCSTPWLYWAVKNEWMDKNPFTAFQLKFKRKERDFLTKLELTAIETQDLDNPILQKVRDLFVFSCYTGLAYVDLMALQPTNISSSVDGMKWIKTSRTKCKCPSDYVSN